MSWLRNRVLAWLGGHPEGGLAPAGLGKDVGSIPLLHLANPENPKALSVVTIRNGFLICSRTYNPNGPDKVEAIFAETADNLGPMLVAEMAAMRITK